MNIDIICIGKIKEVFYREALNEYAKRLSKYCKLNIIELNDEQTPDNAPEAVERKILDTEGKRILAKLSNDAYVIATAIEGKKMGSESFARLIDDLGINGHSRIVFVIGGSLGLSDEVKKRADMLLSFSDMTFPHQLMRVILAEQIYRSYRIINNQPYHK